jgi:hypothetical protein
MKAFWNDAFAKLKAEYESARADGSNLTYGYIVEKALEVGGQLVEIWQVSRFRNIHDNDV